MTAISVELNGVKVNDEVEPRQTLADFLRDRCGLTATHLGCEHGACGACTVVVDGVATRSCLTLAAMADGGSVTVLGMGATLAFVFLWIARKSSLFPNRDPRLLESLHLVN